MSVIYNGGAAATVPGGSNTQVQFNDSNVFGGSSGFTFNKSTNNLSLTLGTNQGYYKSTPDGTAGVAFGGTPATNIGVCLTAALSNFATFHALSLLVEVLTVNTLPAAPAQGHIASVSDGDSGLAWGATVVNTGAGSTKYLVWFNNANWTVIGK